MTDVEVQAPGAATPSTPGALEKRRQLVEATAAVMARQGYAGTSMKDIATEAGLAQGLIHYYFDSKDDLVMAVVKDACDSMLAETMAAFEGARGGPLERVWPALDAARERTRNRPEMWKVFVELLPLSFNNPHLRAQFQELYGKIIEGTLQMIEEVNAQLPTPLPVEARYFARVITAAIDGIALQVLVQPELDIDALYTALGFILVSTIAGSFAVAGQAVPDIDDLPGLLGADPARRP